MWTIFKVIIEFVKIAFLFSVLSFWPVGSLFPSQGWNLHPCVRRQSLNHSTSTEVPKDTLFNVYFRFILTELGHQHCNSA